MNVPRIYNPRLFELLDIYPQMLTKAKLSRKISDWFKRNPRYYNLGIITSNETIYELSDIPIGTTYSVIGSRWWDFITMIYLKWVIRTPALTGITIEDPYQINVLTTQEEQIPRSSSRLASKPSISYKE